VTPANALVLLPLAAVGAGLFLAAFHAVAGGPARSRLLATRLARFETAAFLLPSDTHLERLRQPLSRRVVRPVLERLGRAVSRVGIRAQRAATERRLDAAGGLLGLTAQGYLALQLLLCLAAAACAAAFTLLVGQVGPLAWAIIVVAGALGYSVPDLRLARRIKARRLAILHAMPNALDLLTISVEAGLAFDAAMQRVAEKYHTPLGEELLQVLGEVKLGRSRRDALTALSDRAGLDDLTTFIQAVVQSEQMGTSLGQTLRIQSEEMRRRRRQRAEETGARAPLKMLLPMVGCIFPTIFVVLLGPAALQVYSTFTR